MNINTRKPSNKTYRSKTPVVAKGRPSSCYHPKSHSPAVPLFYSEIYADPPDCSELPPPPESWYITTDEQAPKAPVTPENFVQPMIKERKPRSRSRQYFSRPNSSMSRLPNWYIPVKA